MRLQLMPAVLLALCVLAQACDGGQGAAPTQPGAGGTATREVVTTVSTQVTPSQPQSPLGRVVLQRVFPALSFVRLTGLYELPDGSNRFLAVQQRGVISIFENRRDVAQAATFLDITARVNSSGNEEGLLSLALAPDFQRSGFFYLNYTAQNPRRTVVARYTASADRSRAEAASEQVVIEIGQPFANHNGGQIAFGPDGYLYIGMGDGGSGNDPGNRAQNLEELLGKILRIDVSGIRDPLVYHIPSDNPFAGRQGARSEIWAYGLRNPWRFSFDPANGDLWVGDVGQNAREEVDLVRKGQNYGWPLVEGSQCNSNRGATCDLSSTALPVIDYPTASGNCSVTGGFVYRKGDIPQVQGAYLYADYCSGKVWALRYDGTRVAEQAEVADADFRVSSFATDRSGSLYLLAHGEAPNGAGIYKISGQ